MLRISSLHCYPVKGCRGHALERAHVGALGIDGDRRWMIVDERSRFLSQREVPQLATITPRADADALHLEAGARTIRVPIVHDGADRDVVIWRDIVRATDQGDAVAHWLGVVLGRPCRLVHFGETSHRPIDPAFSPRPDAQTSFTDGYPVLGVVQASLDDLNTRLDQPVPMNRFRPSIVFDGASAWSEDQWRAVSAGGVTLDAVKPCARCVVLTTDQQDGARHPEQEPLRTLATFRTQRPFGAIFGQNLVPRTTGIIEVGMPVAVAS